MRKKLVSNLMGMSRQAKDIYHEMKCRPETTARQLIEKGYGETVNEIDFILTQLKIHGYI